MPDFQEILLILLESNVTSFILVLKQLGLMFWTIDLCKVSFVSQKNQWFENIYQNIITCIA